MFAFTSFSRRRSSASSNCSSGSLSLSPTGWTPSRPTLSPPTLASSASDSESEFIRPTTSYSTATPSKRRPAPRSLSPPPSSFTTTAPATHQACAFPSWPTRDSLTPPASTPSPTSSYFSPSNSLPSSRISDADLEELEFPCRDSEEEAAQCLGISWSQVGANAVAPVQQPAVERRRRLPPPPMQYRRRSSSKVPSRKSKAKGLGAITE